MSVCAIVGAGEGLGAALAARFAAGGFDLALISRSHAGCAAAKAAGLAANPDATIMVVAADATEPLTVENAFAEIEQQLGDVEVLIYNVRDQFVRCEPLEMTYESLEHALRLEVTGAFAAIKSVLPSMRRRQCGTLFFSSATAAFRGSADYPLYSIGKFGLRALSQSFSKAYASDGVHFVHVRLDCDLDTPVMQKLYGEQYDASTLANAAGVAESYWHTYLQPRTAWSNEIELRPCTERWTL